MIPISPLTPDGIAPYIGKPVCAVLQDGKCHYGILGGIGGGQLHLNAFPGGLALAAADGRKIPKTRSAKAEIKAFAPFGFGFGFGALALSLVLLAALFFIPWFWI